MIERIVKYLLSFLIRSFLVMLFWGIVASWFDAPTVSYAQACLLVVFRGIIVGSTFTTKENCNDSTIPD